jgi:hypothetical protein
VDNDEWARYICDQEDKEAEHPPAEYLDPDTISTLGYTPVVGRLDLVLDRLQALESAIIWTANPKEQRPQLHPMPRPETALDRERERRTRSLLDEVDAMLRGDGLPMIFE